MWPTEPKGGLENSWDSGNHRIMNLTADDKGRLTCRELFEPGTIYAANRDGDRVVLTRLESARAPRVKLQRREGRTFLVSDRMVTLEDVQHELEHFP